MSLYVVFLGAPGSGKGTQASRLAKTLKASKIATGELLRSEVEKGSEVGKQAGAYLIRGEFVPDQILAELFRSVLTNRLMERGVVFDGYPRTLAQARDFSQLVSQDQNKKQRILYLDVPKGTILRRIVGRMTCPKCHIIYHDKFNPPATVGRCDVCGSVLVARADDNEATLAKRVELFEEAIRPVLEFFGEQVIRIDGDRPPGLVFSQIMRALEIK